MEESQNQRLLYRPEEVQLLKRLKFENKNLSWAIIMEKYNSEVEPSRKRSEDGLSGKWKQMNKKKRNAKKKKARNNTKPTQDDAAHDFQYDAPISDELARLEMVNNLTQLDQICPFSPTAGFSMFSITEDIFPCMLCGYKECCCGLIYGDGYISGDLQLR